MKCSSGNIHVTPIGLGEIPDEMPVRPKGLPEGDFIFFIGRNSYWKGTDILLEAASSDSFPNGLTLVLAGRPEHIFKKSYEKKLKNTKNVLQLGPITDAEREYLYRNAKLFVYPTRFDGFGMPPVEAALRGCPTLVSNIEIMREVTDGNALFFDLEKGAAGLSGQIAENLNKNHSELIRKAEANAKKYTWEKFAGSFISCLKQSR